MNERAREVLAFWFADALDSARACTGRMRVWFGLDQQEQAAFDAEIRARFGADVQAALRGEHTEWAAEPRGRLALILLLDQFTRNMHRGTAMAFAGDSRALDLVRQGRKVGADRELSPAERLFFYMPLEHSEDPGAQDECVAAFQELVDTSVGAWREFFAGCVPYAEQHRDLIARFGRFPHRNAALGRVSTAAEREYLAGDAPNFGQG